MNYSKLLNKELVINGETMIVTDFCRGCRTIWATSEHFRYYLKVDSRDNIKITQKKLKPLE